MATATQVARGLAWFGIALGTAEILAPKRVARWAGLEGHSRLVRLFGAREILSGVAMLSSEEPQKRLWARVAGDALDTALLASSMRAGNPHRGRTLLATLLVSPVVVMDLLYARKRLAGTGVPEERFAHSEPVRSPQAATVSPPSPPH